MTDKTIYDRIYDAVPQLSRLRHDVLLGDVWQQPELARRDRILVSCSVLAALGKQDELSHWMQRAIEEGISRDELRGLIVHVAFYAGWPAALCAGKAGIDILEAEAADANS